MSATVYVFAGTVSVVIDVVAQLFVMIKVKVSVLEVKEPKLPTTWRLYEPTSPESVVNTYI